MDTSLQLSVGDEEDAVVRKAFKDAFRTLWAVYTNSERGLKLKFDKLENKFDQLEKEKESLDEDLRWKTEKLDQLNTENKSFQEEVRTLRERLSETLQTAYTQALDSEVLTDAQNDARTQAVIEALNEESIADTQHLPSQPPTAHNPTCGRDWGTASIKRTKVSRSLKTTALSPGKATEVSPVKRKMSRIRANKGSPRTIRNVSMMERSKLSEALVVSPGKTTVDASAVKPTMTASADKPRDASPMRQTTDGHVHVSPTIPLNSPCKLKKMVKTTTLQISDTALTRSRSAYSSCAGKVTSPQGRAGSMRIGGITEREATSPTACAGKKNLKLPRINKRHRFSEEDQLDNKRFRINSKVNNRKLSKPHSRNIVDLTMPELKATTAVLVADTYTSQAERQVSGKGDAGVDVAYDNWMQDVDLVIPETVPMDYHEDDYEEEAEVQAGEAMLQSMAIRSQSHSSTCINSSNLPNVKSNKYIEQESPNLLQNGELGFVKRKQRQGDMCANTPHDPNFSTDGEDDVSSEPASPIFKRSTALKDDCGSRDLHVEIQSPSLFDEVPETPTSIPLPPGLINIPTETNVLSQRLSKQGSLWHKQQLDDSYQDGGNSHLSISVQSNPSPSMLSGKIMNKLNEDGNTGWLSTNSASPHTPRQSERGAIQREVDIFKNQSSLGQNKIRGQAHDGDVQYAVDSRTLIRVTRAKQRKLSQEITDPDLNTSKTTAAKALKQTTLSQKFFQPQKTYLPSIESFNGGRLSERPLTNDEQETLDINEAVKRSLSKVNPKQSEFDFPLKSSMNEIRVSQSQYDLSMTEVDMTEPQFTSTPCVGLGKRHVQQNPLDSSFDNMIFKKPSTPTKPMHYPQTHLKDELSQETINPIEISQQSKRTCKVVKSQSRSSTTMQTKRTFDLDDEYIPIAHNSQTILPPSANGSLDPDVRLSELDSDISAPQSAHLTSPTLDNEHFLEPVSFHEIYAAKTENQNAQTLRMPPGKKPPGKLSVIGRGANELDSEEEIGLSGRSIVFGPSKVHTKSMVKDDCKKQEHNKMGDEITENVDDSFDIIPKKKGPGFAHVEVVRKRAEREKLQTYACTQCMDYYRGADLSEEEIRERMKACRHKARYVAPGTPNHYWDIGFPDTQECEERGYLHKTQAKPSNYRRVRSLRALFKSNKDTDHPPEAGDITDLFEGEDTLS